MMVIVGCGLECVYRATTLKFPVNKYFVNCDLKSLTII